MKKYCKAMDTIHAPESLVRKVKSMKGQSKVKRINVKKFAYAAVAAMAILVSSNVVAYAMTGSTWMKKIIIKINGQEQEVEAEHFSYTKDGAEYEGFELQLDEKNLEGTSIEYSSDSDDTIEHSQVVLENDMVYLLVADQRLDITMDIQDGKAKGSFEMNGKTHFYEVEGNVAEGEFSCSIYN